MASKSVCSGWRASVAATSPNESSASTSTHDWPALTTNATARLAASMVLPTPPFAPNTVMIEPRAASSELSARRR